MEFIQTQSQKFSVSMMCAQTNIARSRFYDWRKNPIGKRNLDDKKLTEDIKRVFEGSRQTYGSPRVRASLSKNGIRCSRHRVAKLMKKANLKSKMKRRFKVTTDSKHVLPIAENLLKREFKVDTPNTTWVQDITYIWTNELCILLSSLISIHAGSLAGAYKTICEKNS